jgi:hypothetical protein
MFLLVFSLRIAHTLGFVCSFTDQRHAEEGKFQVNKTHRFLEMWLGKGPLVWNFEAVILGILGISLLVFSDQNHNMGVVLETIVLVVGLGGLMGITRIPFPTKIMGRPIPMWSYPLIAGTLSMFMDSFLVLIMCARALVVGNVPNAKRLFSLYCMAAALIMGLGMYFGEVYALPLALKYGVKQWYGMLPVLPPAIMFTLFLCFLSHKLGKQGVSVQGLPEADHTQSDHHRTQATIGDYAEVAVFILILLATHNAMIFAGALALYAAVTGQGEDFIEVLKTEMEMGVMMLLLTAAVLCNPMGPWIAEHCSGWGALLPSAVNAVITGAVFPVSGNFWFDLCMLSAFILLTPITSLVGIMIFKTAADWKFYIPRAVGLTAVWIVCLFGWFFLIWPTIEHGYYEKTGFQKPAVVQKSQH